MSYMDLIPRDTLIATRRNTTEPVAITEAPSLRLAAAEIVREGYFLHYGNSRYYEIDDPDLALLAGDRMYAAGLAALSSAGDIEAVTALAGLIAGCAEAHALEDSPKADRLWGQTLAMLARGSATHRAN